MKNLLRRCDVCRISEMYEYEKEHIAFKFRFAEAMYVGRTSEMYDM